MKKKIITASFLSFMAFGATPVFATEQIAFALNVYPTCTGCHTNATLSTADNGNLKAAAKTAYNQDKKGLSGLKTFLAGGSTPTPTPTPTCIAPQVLNATKTACVAPPPPTCVAPKILNDAQTACVNPPVPTCSATEILKNNVCVAKPTTPVKNTKPVLNSVAQQWDVQVGELLSIPLSVSDTEQDEFTILTSKLVGSTLSEVHPDAAGLPSIDFEWTPTQANLNKIQAITFQAKEKSTKPALVSNKVSVKVRVWAKGDRNAASITKLNVMTSKFAAGTLKLAGNVKFNSLLTAAERQAFIEQTLDLTVNDVNGSNLYSDSLVLDTKGNWTVSIPMISAPCDITLEFAGQNASRKVIGCTKTAAIDNITLATNDDHDDHSDKDKLHKHDD